MDDSGDTPDLKKILFDMDGVITSELQYWVAAALTVYEKLFDENVNIKWCEDNALELYGEVFNNDETIVILKSLGINTNWDLAYLTYLAVIIVKAKGVEESDIWGEVCEYYRNLSIYAPDLYDYVSNEACDLYNYEFEDIKREGKLWLELQDCFQQWFLGDKLYQDIYKKTPCTIGKTGLIKNEIPLFDLNELKLLFGYLSDKGYTLGVGTGRNNYEIITPLDQWGLSQFFDIDSFITYDDVKSGEAKLCEDGIVASLVKPNPYVFLKGALGKNTEDKIIINKLYDKDMSEYIVVGDAAADLIAAKEANMKFVAVLTGIGGDKFL